MIYKLKGLYDISLTRQQIFAENVYNIGSMASRAPRAYYTVIPMDGLSIDSSFVNGAKEDYYVFSYSFPQIVGPSWNSLNDTDKSTFINFLKFQNYLSGQWYNYEVKHIGIFAVDILQYIYFS